MKGIVKEVVREEFGVYKKNQIGRTITQKIGGANRKANKRRGSFGQFTKDEIMHSYKHLPGDIVGI